MKSVICLCLAIPSAALLTGSGVVFEHPHDAGAVMSQLTGMVGAAQQKLAVAERHHKKLVKKIRKETAAMLDEEAKAYGKVLDNFSLERLHVEEELVKVMAVGKAGLAKAEATPSNVNDWRDPEVSLRAKLGAQLASADRINKKNERHRSRAVREGEERAEEILEENAQKLGMKLGDMTPLVDKAKKTLEAVAEKNIAEPKVNAKVPTFGKKVDLKSLQSDLEKASSTSLKATTEANKKLDGFLSKKDKEVVTKTSKLMDELQTQQKQEIEKVLGKKEEAKKSKPVKKVTKHAVKKAAPVAKKVAPAAKKAAPVAKKVAPAAKKVAPAAKKVAPAAKPVVAKVAKEAAKPVKAVAKKAVKSSK